MKKTSDITKLITGAIPFIIASYYFAIGALVFSAYLAIILVGFMASYAFFSWRDHVNQMNQYGAMYEPLFVIEYPGMRMEFPDAFDDNVVYAEQGRVGEAVVREKQLLAKAGNTRSVEVIPIFFRDGKDRCETVEAYQARCVWIMTEKLNAWNEALKKANPELYNEVHHGESLPNFFEWTP